MLVYYINIFTNFAKLKASDMNLYDALERKVVYGHVAGRTSGCLLIAY